MTGKATGDTGIASEQPLGSLDEDSVSRIDVHLERAMHATDDDRKDFHVRHARQLLEACRDD